MIAKRDKRAAKAFLDTARHPEWREHERTWRRLMDAYQGGNPYRFANYSIDCVDGQQINGYQPFPFAAQFASAAEGVRTAIPYHEIVNCNLIPHRSEMTPQGWDKYILRHSRTPVPKIFERVIRQNVSRIYAQDVQRTTKGLPELEEFWGDVDGVGSSINQWMTTVVAPMLLVYGLLDLAFGRPSLDPNQSQPVTKADVAAVGLDRCVASYILPENMLTWKLDRNRRYLECLVQERNDEGKQMFRHWDAEGWVLYARDGEILAEDDHPFGCVPIVRIFDERNLRCMNVGKPRYDSVAEAQFAIYNAQSELLLKNVYQSTATLAIDSKFINEEGELRVGSGEILPIDSQPNGTPVVPVYVAPPPGSADDLKDQIQGWKDDADRDSWLSKPAGATGKGTVAQSGISKAFDSQATNANLSGISDRLMNAERVIASMAMVILSDGATDATILDQIEIVYAKGFQLFSADEIATILADIHQAVTDSGVLVEVEKEAINRLVRFLLPGLTEERGRTLNKEVDDAIESKSERRQQAIESGMAAQKGLPDYSADDGNLNPIDTLQASPS